MNTLFETSHEHMPVLNYYRVSGKKIVACECFRCGEVIPQTPVERHGGFLVKREDKFEIFGAVGGKARTCYFLAKNAKGLITAGSRSSPQVNIVAHIAKGLGIPCRVHTPQGKLSPEVQQAVDMGAELFQHKAGYNSVIIARAKSDSQYTGYVNIPFGMECEEAVEQTSNNVFSLVPFKDEIKRIVIPVGSAMSLCGIIKGIKKFQLNIPILGIVMGADPTKRLNEYAPDWKKFVTLKNAGIDYHDEVNENIGDIQLDPIYEAKCVKFLERGDLLWIVGIRKSML